MSKEQQESSITGILERYLKNKRKFSEFFGQVFSIIENIQEGFDISKSQNLSEKRKTGFLNETREFYQGLLVFIDSHCTTKFF